MKLEGGERLVLKSLADLQGSSTDYVDDSRLAAATKMLMEDVRDWLETLEGKGFVERTRLTDGFSAYVTAKGKQALRLTDRLTVTFIDARYVTAKGKQALRLTEPNFNSETCRRRCPGHSRRSRWYGNCFASARNHPEDSRTDPLVLRLLAQG